MTTVFVFSLQMLALVAAQKIYSVGQFPSFLQLLVKKSRYVCQPCSWGSDEFIAACDICKKVKVPCIIAGMYAGTFLNTFFDSQSTVNLYAVSPNFEVTIYQLSLLFSFLSKTFLVKPQSMRKFIDRSYGDSDVFDRRIGRVEFRYNSFVVDLYIFQTDKWQIFQSQPLLFAEKVCDLLILDVLKCVGFPMYSTNSVLFFYLEEIDTTLYSLEAGKDIYKFFEIFPLQVDKDGIKDKVLEYVKRKPLLKPLQTFITQKLEKSGEKDEYSHITKFVYLHFQMIHKVMLGYVDQHRSFPYKVLRKKSYW